MMKQYEMLNIFINIYVDKYVNEINEAMCETEAEQLKNAREAANIRGQIKATKRIAKMLFSAEDVKAMVKEAKAEAKAIAEEI